MVKAGVPGALEQFVAGNENAKHILGEGPRYLVAMFPGAHALELTALGALANGFWSVWLDVTQDVQPQLVDRNPLEEGIA
jgi:hypothetical protein